MARTLQIVDPTGAETISGPWNLTHSGSAFPSRTRRIFLTAAAFSQTNGTSMSLTQIGTYPAEYEEWPFATAPGAPPQAIGLAMDIPQDYSSGGTFYVVYTQDGTDVNTWRAEINVLGRADTEDPVAAAETIASSLTPNGSATSLHIDSIGSGGTFAVGDVVRLHFERDSAHGDDTNGDIIRVLGIIFEYTAKY